MRVFADLPAVIWHDQPVNYRALSDRVAGWARRLSEAHISAGTVSAVIGDQSTESLAVLLALLSRRAIAVPVCSWLPQHNDRYFDIVGVRVVIEDSGCGWAIRRREAQSSPPLLDRLRELKAPGLVLFSSGSTGEPKALLWNADELLRRHRNARQRFRTLLFLRLDHIGGLNTIFHALCTGGCIVVTARRDPEGVCQAIEKHRVELLPTTPTFLKMLLISEACEHFDLSSLRLITYGTEPMASDTLRSLCAALPEVEFKQTYGLSELGILPTQSRMRDSLWFRLGGDGYQIRVVDGELWVRSASAMLGYLNCPSPFDAAGWFNTKDAVEVSGEFVRVVGRKSDIINVGGEKAYPADIEAVLTQADNVEAAAVFGRSNPIMGQVVVARVLLRAEEPDAERRLIAFCRAHLSPHQVPMLIEITREPLYSERGKLMRRYSPHG